MKWIVLGLVTAGVVLSLPGCVTTKASIDLPGGALTSSALPPVKMERIAVPAGLLSSEAQGQGLRISGPYSSQSAGNYSARRQRLEAIVEEQLKLNETDLLRSAQELSEIRRKGRVDEARQVVEKEVLRLNSEFADKQRVTVGQSQLQLLNRELGVIALEKSGSIFPGFEDKKVAQELNNRRELLKEVRASHDTSLVGIARSYQDVLARTESGYMVAAENAASKERAKLEQEAKLKSDAMGKRLRSDLGQTFELANGPVDTHSDLTSGVASLNARANSVDASVAAKLGTLRAAVRQAKLLGEAQRVRMVRASENQ